MEEDLLHRIAVDPRVMLGKPVVRGTRITVEILLEKIVNKKDPADTRVIDPLTPVSKANVDEFGKNWDKWLGK